MHFDLNKFWQHKRLLNYLLLPCAGVFYLLSKFKFYLSSSKKVTAKVICVGNITVGGAGKTPLALAIGMELQERGYSVAFISRGYKGKLSSCSQVIKVDARLHTAREVGDEPLLLASIAPTFICINRYLAALQATKMGAQVIIMDDGLQNYCLFKDISILVVDDFIIFGNSFLLPAGPLRSVKSEALKQVDFICINQNKSAPDKHLKFPKPGFFIKSLVLNPHHLRNKKFIIMIGIANPHKFMNTLKDLNIEMVGKFIFPDHHYFSSAELQKVIGLATMHSCRVLTTSKDFTRIPPSLRRHFVVLAIKKVLPKKFVQKIMNSLQD